VGSYFHPVGTCAIGDGELGVVDSALRVRGLAGLRVADGSVMPSIPSANTSATVYAIGERAAELIAET
jgi:choline dehydrogenase